jgi:hypothetical protein
LFKFVFTPNIQESIHQDDLDKLVTIEMLITSMGFRKKNCSYKYVLNVYCVYVQIVWCFMGLCASW